MALLLTRTAEGEPAIRDAAVTARWWRVVVVAVAVVAFAVAVWLGRLGTQPDDAFISYQYAKRLAAGQGFTFSPGAPPTYGATSPLWTLLLAAGARLGWAPHASAPWLFAVFHGASAGLLVSIAGLGAGLAWATALIPLAHVGEMETSLLVALMVLAVAMVRRGSSPRLIGAVCGLILLTRPEGALFVIALAVSASTLDLRWRRRGGLVLVTAALAYLPWALYAWHAFRDLVPLGARSKWATRWLYEPVTLDRLASRWFPGDTGLVVFSACLALAALGACRACREDRRWVPLIAWALVYGAALKLAGAPDFFWYTMPLAWLGLLLVFRGARELRVVMKGRAVPAAAPVLACLLLVGWQGTAGVRQPPAWHRLHRDLAQYVRAHSRPGDLIAAREVGNLAYWTDRPMLDLLGVTDPTVVPELRLGRMERAIEARHPAFVVTYMDRGDWRRDYRLVYTRWWGRERNYAVWERQGRANGETPHP